MIPITLKAKHFYYISYFLKDQVAHAYFNLLNSIKAATANVEDMDDVTISVSVNDVVRIYSILTLQPEGTSNNINTEMYTMIATQIGAALQGNTNLEEWQSLAAQVTAMRNNALAAANTFIESGKTFIRG